MQAALPRECCGLLLGAQRRIYEAVALRNITDAADRFTLDPLQAAAVERAARARGLRLLGYFHSHPAGPPTPSAADIAEVLWPGQRPALHLICTPRDGWRLYEVRATGWVGVRCENIAMDAGVR